MRTVVGLARFHADGRVDTGFGSGATGTVTDPGRIYSDLGYDVSIGAGRAILVAGSAYESAGSTTAGFSLARYTAEGAVDTAGGFGEQGQTVTAFPTATSAVATGLMVQSDGRIVLGGHINPSSAPTSSDIALARYGANGLLDTSFGAEGSEGTEFTAVGAESGISRLARGPNSSIVVVGASAAIIGGQGSIAVARYLGGEAPSSSSPPTISGTPEAGQALTASQGSWSASPTSYSYQWFICGPGGTHCEADGAPGSSNQHTITSADVAHGGSLASLLVRVTASNPAGGRSQHPASSSPVTVGPSAPPPLETSVQGIEVTQGVQTLEPPGPLRPGTQRSEYGASQVPLVAGKPLIVRVFATSNDAQFGHVTARLTIAPEGTTAGYYYPANNHSSPDLSTAPIAVKERETEGGFTFTVADISTTGPTSMTGRKLYISVELYGPNLTNSSGWILGNVVVHPTHRIHYQLVALTDKGVMPPDPHRELDRATNLVPGQIDWISGPNVEIGELRAEARSRPGFSTGSSLTEQGREWFQDEVRELLRRADSTYAPSAAIDGTLGYGEDQELGLTTGSIFSNPRPVSQVAVAGKAGVEDDRPYTSVAHEIFHGLGLLHASKECGGGGKDGTRGEAWPNKNGNLEGIGLDISSLDASGDYPLHVDSPTGGKPKERAWDLMSYCAEPIGEGDPTSWLSARSWTTVFNELEVPLAAAARARAHLSRASSPRTHVAVATRALTSIRGFVAGGQVVVADISPTTTPSAPLTRGGEATDEGFRVSALNSSGHRTATAVVRVEHDHINRGPAVTFLSAVLPGHPRALEITRAGRVLVKIVRSAHPATPRALRVRNAVKHRALTRATTVLLTWRTVGGRGARPVATVEFSGDGGKSWRIVFIGPNRNRTQLATTQLTRTRRGLLRVVLSAGLDRAAATVRLPLR
jgi:uncharacterized delta-60 repeat protein